MARIKGISIHITGIVQGVGFRPFIFNLAERLALTGWIRNTSAGVDIEINGNTPAIEAFVSALEQNPPPLAIIDSIDIQACQPNGYERFEIVESKAIANVFQPISPDTSICSDCLRDIFDKDDRRYLYPFTNCTNCGPRFTIIEDIPYDRPSTTMAEFEMCAACQAEYTDPTDRRFHAQPIACPECGPYVWLEINDGKYTQRARSNQAMIEVQRLLAQGKIVAIKGLGGFHLACDANNHETVAELRRRKLRIDKPFALMLPDISTIETHCLVNSYERNLLTTRERPIVILTRRATSDLAKEIAPGQDTLGVMLPYTPLHYLLFADIEQRDQSRSEVPALTALVMTSGNLMEEPIATDNQEARERLSNLADAFLMHNRRIHVRCDDSVCRVFTPERVLNEAHAVAHPPTLHIRRSRGYAPSPVHLPWSLAPILATGPELKNTFCLAQDRYAFVSHHIGDLENYETLKSFEEGIEHFEGLFRINPHIIAYDLHPNYLSTQYALQRAAREDIRAAGIQHHHAHIAACMAENGLLLDHKPVLGIALDGTGYGDDGSIWGGEFMIADYHGYQRILHLKNVPLVGGDKAIRQPWRMALAWLAEAGVDWRADLPTIQHLRKNVADANLQMEVVKKQLDARLNAPLTSSMGRLFDAVASLCDVRHEANYEAQAAIELESRVDRQEHGSYPFEFSQDEIEIAPLMHAMVADIRSGISIPSIAARFHNTVAKMVLCAALQVQTTHDIREVVLSGGVWQNMVLLSKSVKLLQDNNFTVYRHQKVPTNDGGVALGQAVIAGARFMETRQ